MIIFWPCTNGSPFASDYRPGGEVLESPIRLFLPYCRLQQPHTQVLYVTVDIHAERQPKTPCTVHLAKHHQLLWKIKKMWFKAMGQTNGVRAVSAKCMCTKVGVAIDDYNAEHPRRCDRGEDSFQKSRCHNPCVDD